MDESDRHADNHLNDLDRRDERSPLRTDAAGGKEIIKIHDGMDEVVHGDEPEVFLFFVGFDLGVQIF